MNVSTFDRRSEVRISERNTKCFLIIFVQNEQRAVSSEKPPFIPLFRGEGYEQ